MQYPNLNNSKIISFDIETYDPELGEKGSGVYRKDGCILGISISDGEFNEYYNLGHKNCTQNIEKNIKYIKDVLSNNVPKIGANLLYDIDWLENEYNFKIKGELNDVQIAEPLLCEFRDSFSLDSLGETYLNEHKKSDELIITLRNKGVKTDNPRAFMYLLDYNEVRDYAIQDSKLPIKIFEQQKESLIKQDLFNLYRMEMDLFPLLLHMRKIGVRIDMELVKQKINYLNNEIYTAEKTLVKEYGNINVKSSSQISKVFDELNIPYSRHNPTENMLMKGSTLGNPKLDKEELKCIDHPFVDLILKIREFKTIRDTFFIGAYSKMPVRSRIHTMFYPLKTDEYGTVSGRFSSSKPNLQNQPGKDETMGTFCREVFLPESEHLWGKLDWSQIEYRLISHYAEGEKSEKIRAEYNNNPKTDYHQMIMDWTGLQRKEAKMLNFGMAYFMGIFSCSKKFGWSMEQAKEFVELYHKEVPFIKTTRKHVVDIAKVRGFVRTILKRRARISPKMLKEKKEYSIFNRLIQGSAADIMKKAMVDAYKKGLFNTLIPHITVHDELDVSIPKTKEGIEAIKELKHTMESCVQLRVPILADLEIGTNWSNVSSETADKFIQGEYL